MAGMSVDGLISGLDTTSLVNQLMQVEALQQTKLRVRVSSNDALIDVLQGLNTKVTALQAAAEKLTTGGAWGAVTAATTGDSVAATASAGAAPATHTVTVTSVAAAHSLYTDATFTDPDATTSFDTTGYPIEISRVDSAGNSVVVGTVTPASGSLNDVVAAVNAAATELGVKAQAVQTAPGEYRLQLTSTTTGQASQFTVSGVGVTSTGVQGADTELTLDGLTVRRPTTTISDLVPGLVLTARQTGTTTVQVESDPGSVADAVAAMVDAANAVLDDIGTKSAYDATTRTGGPLTGNTATRDLAQGLLRAVPGAVGDPLTSAAGVQTTRDGRLVFDREAFLAAYADDPTAVRAALAPEAGTGLAQRLVSVAEGAVRTTAGEEGTLVRAVTGVESRSQDLTRQIEAWDTRLEMRRSALQREFAGLEVALNKLQSQSQWLFGQLAGLSGNQA